MHRTNLGARGGQGPRLGDDGSAFDIGSRAVARAMKEREQVGTDSILGMKILEAASIAPPGRNCNSAPPCSQITFSRRYFPSWLLRPTPKILQAREILRQAASELSSLVATISEHSGNGRENIRIVKTGGP